MPIKPKKKWQVAVKMKMATMGITQKELAERTGQDYDLVRQVMCQDNMPRVRKSICDYLGLDLERLLKDESEGIN